MKLRQKLKGDKNNDRFEKQRKTGAFEIKGSYMLSQFGETNQNNCRQRGYLL